MATTSDRLNGHISQSRKIQPFFERNQSMPKCQIGYVPPTVSPAAKEIPMRPALLVEIIFAPHSVNLAWLGSHQSERYIHISFFTIFSLSNVVRKCMTFRICFERQLFHVPEAAPAPSGRTHCRCACGAEYILIDHAHSIISILVKLLLKATSISGMFVPIAVVCD